MRTQSPDTPPEIEEVQLALLRKKSIPERMALVQGLSATTIRLARQAIARNNPDKNEQELNLLFIKLYHNTSFSYKNSRFLGKKMTNVPDIISVIKPVTNAFEELGIDYQIGGSIASSVYGVPRSTLDADLVADIRPKHIHLLVNKLESNYYIDELMIREAIKTSGSFNLVHYQSTMKIDVFIPKPRAYDKESLQRRRQQPLDETKKRAKFYLVSPEDIILNKLEWYRLGNELSDRQWNDVLGVLKVQKDRLDIGYLQRWALELGILDLLNQAFEDAGS
ncbi:hypothetical protein GWO43_26995 [candidate division KSB1 bacterium]|nr:hypothetical protein [candidate division KSB1 bacterium]NIR70205.1 hypothetical protein [candidate division KSB1 bacterium]NIS27592.1 hypothetical protein [candidate division KSB1 bacterium]NIT74444.1 hypothetical protein [candidate division KSB1 bacterium]NIU28309.1 hypothetical protein [candidate division KSB1 bacterium]